MKAAAEYLGSQIENSKPGFYREFCRNILIQLDKAVCKDQFLMLIDFNLMHCTTEVMEFREPLNKVKNLLINN